MTTPSPQGSGAGGTVVPPAAVNWEPASSIRTETAGLPREAAERVQRVCEVCGNDYDKTFEVVLGGRSHVFDCFECAIHALAPSCSHCGCRIVGHGMESNREMYCCAHCAQARGVEDLKDRS